jgi:hypothetical protein
LLTLDGAVITKVQVIGDPIQLTAAASQLA